MALFNLTLKSMINVTAILIVINSNGWRSVSWTVDYVISFLTIAMFLTCPVLGRSSTLYTASVFSPLEKFSFLWGNGCITVGHCEVPATYLQKETT